MTGDAGDIELSIISALPDADLKVIGLDLCSLVGRDIDNDVTRSARKRDGRAMLAVMICRASTP